jgi:hypothetical protein
MAVVFLHSTVQHVCEIMTQLQLRNAKIAVDKRLMGTLAGPKGMKRRRSARYSGQLDEFSMLDSSADRLHRQRPATRGQRDAVR